METTDFGFTMEPGDKFENMFKHIYEAGKLRPHEDDESHTKAEYKSAITYYVEENMVGKITKIYGKDQQCFDALGMIHTIAKEQFPDSGIHTVADETFEKMYANVTDILNMSCDSKDAKQHQQKFDLMDSNFNIIVNDGAEKILGLIKKIK
ncbi:MAG: hypothetical protein GOV02_02800 [Candidatus Aenigmarchaeota archaeon]|nr:hypothetical protein [Candidatus Aenigmarchaeota archaeon]